MKTYTFWNNKGGTGKTSLCFQTSVQYAIDHPQERILVIDLCPQANLSELMLGGLEGHGNAHLTGLYSHGGRRVTIGGYFDDHLKSSYTMIPGFNPHNYLCLPNAVNVSVPNNVDLLAGDPYVEQLVNSMSALASINVANINTYIAVVSWLKDFLCAVQEEYNVVFIDTNPSFAIYTQMAIAASDFLLVPLTADDSSVRAVYNLLALVYGISASVTITNTFYNQMKSAGLPLPKIHMVIKNRLTQYMGAARAYNAVLNSITSLIGHLGSTYGQTLSSAFSTIDVRDFQSTGVVAYAQAKVFSQLSAGNTLVDGNPVQLTAQNIQNCANEVAQIVALL